MYDLSVIVIFHNMQREAQRTLFAFTRAFQRDIEGLAYEVIAIDSGSSQPLERDWVESLGPDFRHVYYEPGSPSPCAALNHGVEIARSDQVVLCIDGARIPSPGMLHYSALASRLHENAFVYTLGMHIGPKVQNLLVEESYSREHEDRLMASVDWEHDGYLLFEISSLAAASRDGYLSAISESNCVTLSRKTYERIGGYDTRFISPGGGIANLDFFDRAHDLEDAFPVMLLGEATFHQFHGGVATNVAMKNHPWEAFTQEYLAIKGTPYKYHPRIPVYFGKVHPRCMRFLSVPREDGQAKTEIK